MMHEHRFPSLKQYQSQLPKQFTLAAFQAVVQSTSPLKVHKASFRRLLHQYGVVVPLGKYRAPEGRGRPAELFRFAPLPASDAWRVAYLLAQWSQS